MDLEALSEEGLLSSASWAQETGLWDGREVTVEQFSEVSKDLQDRICFLLSGEQLPQYELCELSARLAYLGSENREGLSEDVKELGFTKDGLLVQQAGFGKSLSKFWKKHKTEIIVGAAIVAVVTTVAIVAITSGGIAAGAGVAAGSTALKNLQDGEIKPGCGGSSSTSEVIALNCDQFLDAPIVSSVPEIVLDPHPKPLDPTTFLKSTIGQSESPQAPMSGPVWVSEAPKMQQLDSPLAPQEHLKSERTCPTFSSKEPPFAKSVPQWMGQMLVLSDDDALPSPPKNNTSMIFRTKGESSSRMRIGGINGVGNSLEDAIKHAEYVSNFAGGKSIDWVYNHSNTAPVDVLEATCVNIPGRSPNTGRLLRENWEAFHLENIDNPKAKCLEICHSQATAHVRNALQDSPEEIRNRVIVVAIAPSAVVSSELCFLSFNYACKTDIVPKAEVFVSGLMDLGQGTTPARILSAIEIQNQLILRDPHPDSRGMGHGLQDPTYAEDIKRNIEDYLERGGEYDDNQGEQ